MDKSSILPNILKSSCSLIFKLRFTSCIVWLFNFLTMVFACLMYTPHQPKQTKQCRCYCNYSPLLYWKYRPAQFCKPVIKNKKRYKCYSKISDTLCSWFCSKMRINIINKTTAKRTQNSPSNKIAYKNITLIGSRFHPFPH